MDSIPRRDSTPSLTVDRIPESVVTESAMQLIRGDARGGRASDREGLLQANRNLVLKVQGYLTHKKQHRPRTLQ